MSDAVHSTHPETSADCEPQIFRDVVGRFASGVTVITTHHDGVDFGMTASAMCSLSLEPPMVLVCVNRRAGTRSAVSNSGAFGVNILHEDQADLAVRFATPQHDKFAGIEYARGDLGCPRLDGVLAWLECEVVEDVEGGTHSVFIGRVHAAEGREGDPLAYFRGQFGRLYSNRDDPIAASLREHVIGAELDDGPLDLQRLAEALRVGRSDLDRSIARLMSEGVVAHEPEVGYVLRPIDERTIDRTFDARCAMELGAVEVALAGQPDAGLVAKLRDDMARTRLLVRDGRLTDVREYAAANARFHETLVKLAGSPPLLDAYRRLSLPGILVRAITPSRFASDELIDDHEALVEAIERADLPAARAAIQRHTEHTKDVHRRAAAG
jgi:flavin reductase (DIM6/NTAB) family NADH-FMN oxidoreductase RutF/DNA-binding FadR family transcriptional regulator